jgi:hypothetical protein
MMEKAWTPSKTFRSGVSDRKGWLRAYGCGQICLRQEVSRTANDGKSLGAIEDVPI